MSNRILLTREGLKNLKEEYRQLTSVKRPQIVAKIEEMRSLGDLSENEAYKEARRQQSFIEGRIAEVEGILKKAEVIKQKNNGQVQVGSKIKVWLEGEEQEIQLVDENEADLSAGKISHQSPIGQALIGKRVGDEIEVEVPVGKVRYKVLEICAG